MSARSRSLSAAGTAGFKRWWAGTRAVRRPRARLDPPYLGRVAGQAAIPRYDDVAVEATIAYCEYLYTRYGRFSATNGPFRTILAYQAHHLDETFYDRFYRPEALSPT